MASSSRRDDHGYATGADQHDELRRRTQGTQEYAKGTPGLNPEGLREVEKRKPEKVRHTRTTRGWMGAEKRLFGWTRRSSLA
jgi:hypothetical protein